MKKTLVFISVFAVVFSVGIFAGGSVVNAQTEWGDYGFAGADAYGGYDYSGGGYSYGGGWDAPSYGGDYSYGGGWGGSAYDCGIGGCGAPSYDVGFGGGYSFGGGWDGGYSTPSYGMDCGFGGCGGGISYAPPPSYGSCGPSGCGISGLSFGFGGGGFIPPSHGGSSVYAPQNITNTYTSTVAGSYNTNVNTNTNTNTNTNINQGGTPPVYIPPPVYYPPPPVYTPPVYYPPQPPPPVYYPPPPPPAPICIVTFSNFTPPAIAREGEWYSYTVQATSNFPYPVSYRLVSGPDGLTVSPYGQISWTPAFNQGRNAPYEVRIAAYNGNCESVRTIYITVVDMNPVPPPPPKPKPVPPPKPKPCCCVCVTCACPTPCPAALQPVYPASGPKAAASCPTVAAGSTTGTPNSGTSGSASVYGSAYGTPAPTGTVAGTPSANASVTPAVANTGSDRDGTPGFWASIGTAIVALWAALVALLYSPWLLLLVLIVLGILLFRAYIRSRQTAVAI